MTLNNYIFVFASVLYFVALTNASPFGGMSDDATFRAFDTSDTHRVMRDTPDFEDGQIDKYCDRHEEHFSHYCAGEGSIDKKLIPKILKFCPAFERFCPEMAKKQSNAVIIKRDSGVPLVEPPPLPSASALGGMQFDKPIDIDRTDQVPEREPGKALSPDLIKTCTPDCTAPHCTRECKCANTHPSVHAKCNPPPSSALAGVCQAWYNKCPMFKPVSF